MTDTSHPVTAITGPHFPPTSVPATLTTHHPHGHAPSMLDGTHEDDGQISCICGYADDDGSTVACDICNRWQHIVCYYPQYAEHLPDDLQHYCIDCRPQQLNIHAARARQEETRARRYSINNGVKRKSDKTHKKKVKELANSPHTHGWTLDKSRHDRNSASPRDQPPPAKRPKTSHRTSNSTAAAVSRKRNGSTINHRRSLSRSPEAPIEMYSDIFLRCYAEDDWTHTDTNVWDGIEVTNVLNECITLPDPDFRRHTDGIAREEIFNRWNGEMRDIPGQGELDVRDAQDNTVDLNGCHPAWKWLTVKEPLPAGAFIGEITGHVGMKHEYREDPSNRWVQIRHPEPFVFFHPVLPVYIDARSEGTELRYVRRSCRPNAMLTVMVTGQTDCHFSFIAKHAIEPGEEITISWDVADGPPETVIEWATGNHARGENLAQRDINDLQSWVSTVLANCGPCACQGPDCLMAQFDRRGAPMDSEDTLKAPKPKRKKTAHDHISPPNTGYAANSRSGSEVRKVEADDEQTDSRSVSGSAGRGSTSRDNTPNTHYSANGILPEMSERERKKLAREEEIFRKQEEEKKDKQAKTKKRTSGGPNVNTTAAPPLKHAASTNGVGAVRYADQAAKIPSLPGSKSTSGKRSKDSSTRVTPKESANKPAPRSLKGPKPVYVNAETQCDMDEDDLKARRLANPPARKFTSASQRMLDRCARNNAKRKATAIEAKAKLRKVDSASNTSVQASKELSPPTILPKRNKASPNTVWPIPQERQDVSMLDADEDESSIANATTKTEPAKSPALSDPNTHTILPSTQPPTEDPPPPRPPWQPRHTATTHPLPSSSAHTQLHMPMPPPPSNPFAPPNLIHQSSSTGSNAVVQSPAQLHTGMPLFSPSVAAAVNPSPARKKLSLSDYTKRSKAKDHSHDAGTAGGMSKAERDSSPGSVVSAGGGGAAAEAGGKGSGLVVAPLAKREGSVGSQAVEDDAVMEKVGGDAHQS